MKEFSVTSSPLTGKNLIEASAGTGKTYTISMIYLRLIAEQKLTVDNILVVTFTKPATAELRTRIRECIKSGLDFIESGRPADPNIMAILSAVKDRAGLRERLHSSLRSFDEASVFTIHSFCQQVLTDNAFESGSPFRADVSPDSGTAAVAVKDYWRSTLYECPVHAAAVLSGSMDPDGLMGQYRRRPLAPEVLIEPETGEITARDVVELYDLLLAEYGKLAVTWTRERVNVESVLFNDSSLDGRSYSRKSVPLILAAMDGFFKTGDPLIWNDRNSMLTREVIEEKTKKGHEPPLSMFFEEAGRFAVLLESYNSTAAAYRVVVKKGLFDYVDRRVREERSSSGTMGYDDLIKGVYDGILSPEGELLVSSVRWRYRAALIDEFQDTDSLQFSIFSSMFGGGDTALFLIGDPKQAIYRFRGADIFSYMRAADMVDHRYTLASNWRSTGGLVDAVNTVFGGCENPFVFRGIEFRPVKPGAADQGHDLMSGPERVAPMVVQVVENSGEDEGFSPGMDVAVSLRVASEISLMLSGEYSIDGKKVGAGDIAVLVRKNHQGMLVKAALSETGIPSVTRSTDSVFSTEEAREMFFVLSSVLHPSDSRRMRTALATAICGYSAEAICSMYEDRTAESGGSILEDDVSERFHRYREAWNSGFMEMFRSFLDGEAVAERLFPLAHGQRRMANILHLAEVINNRVVSEHLSPAATVSWVAGCIAYPPVEEDYNIRLETDDRAVNIMTIHSSKGLEFPVVFCPYLTSFQTGNEEITIYHDPGRDFKPAVYLDSRPPETVSQFKKEEDTAESSRLIYVALTRAKSHCRVILGISKKFRETRICSILFSSRSLLKDSYTGEIDPGKAVELLSVISSASGGNIAVSEASSKPASVAAARSDKKSRGLTAREFKGDMSRRWMMYSYSGITYRPDSPEEREDEKPDSRPFIIGAGVLPRGARAGLCVHEIFEKSDFTAGERGAFMETVGSSLRRYGFGPEYEAYVLDMVMKVLSTPIDGRGLRLSSVGAGERLSELEFHFPSAPASEIREFFRAGDICDGIIYGSLRENLSSIPGMMKGFIDMVFIHEEKYYIVDWKSNMLDASYGDYSLGSVLAEMAAENYHLQYYIYTLALHRYLAFRMGKEYSYDRHFGGVYYLFVRGMNGRDNGSGVFCTRPGYSEIDRLNRFFSERG